MILSACTGQQNSSSAGPGTTTVVTTKNAPADACASATKTTLEAVLRANTQISDALVIDSKGLQGIKCSAHWAVAHFTNNIEGGRVVFQYQNGSWTAKDGGTDVCEDIPAAISKKICG